MLDYNTAEGIEGSMHSLETFNELLAKRTEAGYVHKKNLDNFIVLGRYWLDTCGNVGVITGFIPAEHIPNLAPVLTNNEIWATLREYDRKTKPNVLSDEEINSPKFDWSKNKRPFSTSLSWNVSNTIPPARIECPVCKEKWNMTNTHDVIRKGDNSQIVSLAEFVGQSFAEFERSYKERTDAVYMFRNEKGIRNDKHIDLTPDPEYKSLKINERGWVDVKGDYIIEEGDEANPAVATYYHKKCIVTKAKLECKKHYSEGGKNYKQGNLAGLIECDPYVKLELQLAGITLRAAESKGEVPCSLEGILITKLGEFKFRRAWYYWVVEGNVPLELAEAMYANEVGKKTVRVTGHCGCPPPKKWTTRIDDDGKEVADNKELKAIESDRIKESLISNPKYLWVDEPEKIGKLFITSYHIDSWEGLKLFADTVKAA